MWGSRPHIFFFRGTAVQKNELERRVAAHVLEQGFELVDFRLGGSKNRPHLAVRIDWAEVLPGRTVTVDDCATVSRSLEEWLDRDGVGGGRYILEVSTPGLDRPLRHLGDWRRFTGRQVDVLIPSAGGRFRVTHLAVIEGDEPEVELEFPKGDRRTLRLSDIKEARLGFDW